QLHELSKEANRYAGETQINLTSGMPEPTARAAAANDLRRQINEAIVRNAPEWGVANENYGVAKTARGFDRRSVVADTRSQGRGLDYASRMQNEATKMLVNPGATRGFTPEQLDQLRILQKGSPALDLIGDQLGNKVKFGTGQVVGGLAGGIPGY